MLQDPTLVMLTGLTVTVGGTIMFAVGVFTDREDVFNIGMILALLGASIVVTLLLLSLWIEELS